MKDYTTSRPQRRNRRDGQWIGRVSFGSREHRVQETRRFPTKDLRDAWLWERRMEKRKGLGPTPTLTIGEVMDLFLDARELKGLRARTLMEYRRYVASFPEALKAVRASEDAEVKRAVTQLVLGYRRRGRDGDLRSADQHALDMVRIIFHWAAGRGHLLLRNPLTDLDLPTAKAARKDLPPKWKDSESVSLFRAEASRLPAPYSHIVLMGLHHAPRVGEILGLEWPQVDLFATHPTMRIVQDITRYKGTGQAKVAWHFDPPKSLASHRSIRLDREIVSGLFEIQRAQQAAKRVLGRAYGVPGHPERDLVFCHEDGHPVDARTFLRRRFHPLCDRTGMPQIHFHQLRDRWASDFLARGGSPKDAAAMLGHATPEMVMKIYAQQMPEAQVRVQRLVADGIRGHGQSDEEGVGE